MLLAAGASILVLVYGIYRYILDRRFRLPPGPMPLPYIGSLWKLGLLRKKLPFGFGEISKQYGPVFTFYMGSIRMIALQDPKLIAQTLGGGNKQYASRLEERLPGFRTLKPGIVFANGELWKRNRRLGLRAMKDFGMGREMMVVKIQEEVRHLLADLEQYAKDGRPFSPKVVIGHAVFNVIASLVFGRRFDDRKDPLFVELLGLLDTIVERSTAESGVYMLLPFLQRFGDAKFLQIYSHMTKLVGDRFEQCVDEARLDFDPTSIRHFPDIYLRQTAEEDRIEMEQFRPIMFDVFGAGSETSTTSLTWAMFYVAKHPEIQRKCHQVLDEAIGHDRLPSTADRPNLVYLDAFFHEVLRHVSVLPLGLFHTNLDQSSEIAGYECPPNTCVMYNVTMLHHDKAYWGDPEQFRPERWIDENGALKSHGSNFMPFGLGPRICMGEAMARAEFFLMLSAMLHRFNFELEDPSVSYDDGHWGIVHRAPKFQIIATKR